MTGEGSLDEQTLQGKVVSKVHELCLKHSKPLFIICGVNKLTELAMQDLKGTSNIEVFDLVSRYGLERSLKETGACITELLREDSILDRMKSILNSI